MVTCWPARSPAACNTSAWIAALAERLPAGTTSNRFNPSEPAGCNPPATVNVDLGPGGRNGCSFDYMRDTEIYPDSTRLSFLGRATAQVAGGHRAYLEGLFAETVSDYVLSPVPQRIRNLPVSILPEPYRSVLSAPGLPQTLNGIRLRMVEAGNRTSEVTSEATRLVLGLEGRLGEWGYDTALVRADNSAVDKYTNGYPLYNEFVAGIASGVINPFGESSLAGQDLIRSLRVRDEARQSEGTTTSLDASATRSAPSTARRSRSSRRRRCSSRTTSPATAAARASMTSRPSMRIATCSRPRWRHAEPEVRCTPAARRVAAAARLGGHGLPCAVAVGPQSPDHLRRHLEPDHRPAVQLSNNYSSGYRDHNVAYDPVSDEPLTARDVSDYSLWDLTGSWQAMESLAVRAGVLNLADEMPPFSNQAYYFLATYDPSHTDPRGRTIFASLSYAFR